MNWGACVGSCLRRNDGWGVGMTDRGVGVAGSCLRRNDGIGRRNDGWGVGMTEKGEDALEEAVLGLGDSEVVGQLLVEALLLRGVERG